MSIELKSKPLTKRSPWFWLPGLVVLIGLAAIVFQHYDSKTLTSPGNIYSIKYPRDWQIDGGFSSQCSFDNCFNATALSSNKQIGNGPYVTLTLVKSNLSASKWFTQTFAPYDGATNKIANTIGNISILSTNNSKTNGYDTYHETDMESGVGRNSNYAISHNGYILYIFSSDQNTAKSTNAGFEAKIVSSVKFYN